MITSIAEASNPQTSYLRCFNEEQSKRLIIQLNERDSYLYETQQLRLLVDTLKLKDVYYNSLQDKLTVTTSLLTSVEQQNTYLKEQATKSQRRLCNSRKCRVAITTFTFITAGAIFVAVTK